MGCALARRRTGAAALPAVHFAAGWSAAAALAPALATAGSPVAGGDGVRAGHSGASGSTGLLRVAAVLPSAARDRLALPRRHVDRVSGAAARRLLLVRERGCHREPGARVRSAARDRASPA